jgi:hypothetical protein
MATGIGPAGIHLQTSQGGLGDGTAELISNLIGVNALTVDETRNSLAILRSSFEMPESMLPSAREPSRTLLLLLYPVEPITERDNGRAQQEGHRGKARGHIFPQVNDYKSGLQPMSFFVLIRFGFVRLSDVTVLRPCCFHGIIEHAPASKDSVARGNIVVEVTKIPTPIFREPVYFVISL